MQSEIMCMADQDQPVLGGLCEPNLISTQNIDCFALAVDKAVATAGKFAGRTIGFDITQRLCR